MFPYQNPELTPEERTYDLLSRMTIEEKIGQTVKLDGVRCYRKEYDGYLFSEKFLDFTRQWIPDTMSVLLRADWWTGIGWNNGIPPGRMRKVVIMFQKYVYETSRLHIPLYIMEEVSHGLMALGATVFLAGIGMGAMWDDKLMEEIGRVVGEEASSAGVQATQGPLLDVIRDIRWSRMEENYAEAPKLTAVYAIAYTKGLQAAGVVSTLKYFCGHGSPEGGHNHGPAHAGPVEMFNCQLRPVRIAVTAGARSVMSSYNSVDSEPVTGSFRNRENLRCSAERGIRLSGPQLDRPTKVVDPDVLKQQLADNSARNAIEGKFGQCKRRLGLGRVMARRKDSSETVIAITILTANLIRWEQENASFLFFSIPEISESINIDENNEDYRMAA